MKKGSFKLMKKMNQRLILKIVQRDGPISRADIVDKTGLVPATVSNNVKELIKSGLVKESSRGKSRGGRKPILLKLNPGGAYFIGLEWGITEIKGVLLNFSFKEISFDKITVNDYSPESFIELSTGLIKKYSAVIDDKDKIYGVGIGLHGLVQPEQGISIYAPHFNWEEIKIKAMMEENIELPVFLDNDVRVMALAEKWQGRAQNLSNFIFINTGSGIGAGVVLDNKLYYGNNWTAGEFGHMSIVNDGVKCSCGNYGCLEALISTDRLVKKYNGINDFIPYQELKERWMELIRAAEKGDLKAEGILKEAGQYLGTGIANLFNFINPEAVFIGGDFLMAEGIILPIIREQTEKKVLRVLKNRVKIHPTSFGGRVGSTGAAALAMRDLFKLDNRV